MAEFEDLAKGIRHRHARLVIVVILQTRLDQFQLQILNPRKGGSLSARWPVADSKPAGRIESCHSSISTSHAQQQV